MTYTYQDKNTTSESYQTKNDTYTGTGTVTTTGTAVVGSSTLFTTELIVGNGIFISGQGRVVSVITDDTHLTLDSALSSDVAGQAFTYNKKQYQTKN